MRPVFELRCFGTMDLLIEITKRLIEGEVFRSESNSGYVTADNERLAMHYNRGGCLCSLSAQLGGELADCGTLEKRALAEYGWNVGFVTCVEETFGSRDRDRIRELRSEFAFKALRSLDVFPQSSHKVALRELATVLHDRETNGCVL